MTPTQKEEIHLPIEEVNRIVDATYVTAVFNVVGIEGLTKELDRLKSINITPHELIYKLRKQGEDE